jgi:hypothetical protein
MAGNGESSGAREYVTISPDDVGTTFEEQQNILQEIQGRNLPENSSHEECQNRWALYEEPAVVHHRVTKLPADYAPSKDFPTADEDSKSWIATMVPSNVLKSYWMVSLATTRHLAAT